MRLTTSLPGVRLSRRLGAALAWAACLSLCLSAPAWAENLPGHQLQAALERSLQEHRIPGAVAVVVAPDGSRWTGAAGWADYDHPKAMNPGLSFHIGSLTKSFTATLCLRLVDFGLVSLEDTVEAWLPGLVSGGELVTVRNLLNMRSGLGHYERNQRFIQRFVDDPTHQWTAQELAGLAGGLMAEPGAAFDYNNLNYILAGLIAEKAINLPYHLALRALVLEPAGLVRTSVPLDRFMPWPYAKGYLSQNGQAVDRSQHWDPSGFGAAGSIISTAGDITRWLEVLLGGSLLSQTSHREQFDLLPIAGGGGAYGMGVGRRGGFLGHTGNYNGLYTAAMYQAGGYRFIVLANGQAPGGGQGSRAANVMEDLSAALL
jgi:D-alanyl-D-alanine carboxypeptidase